MDLDVIEQNTIRATEGSEKVPDPDRHSLHLQTSEPPLAWLPRRSSCGRLLWRWLSVRTRSAQRVSATIAAVLVALYLPSYLDGAELTGERYWPAFAAFSQKHLSGIKMTLEYEEPVDPKKQYMFCSHPHGLLSAHHGILMQGASEPSFHELSSMASRHHLVASVVFRIPLYREYCLWLGCVDANRKVAERVLQNEKSLVILVGGITEQTIYVQKRKGHVRLALKYGTPIVPGYGFGETDLYTHSDFLLSFHRMFAKFSVALLVGYGSFRWFPVLPHKGVKINQVFSRPIPVQKIDDPSAEDIDKLHAQYVSELVRVFDKYKEKYGYKNAILQVC